MMVTLCRPFSGRSLLGAGLLLSAWLCAPVPAFADDLFYKYDNQEGVTVIDDHVPPQFADKGYVVLNRAGRVVEVVPRALTESERSRPDSGAVQARLRSEESQRQKLYDEALLARYSSVADIEDVKRRKDNELQVHINGSRGSIAGLKLQLEKAQAQAADLEVAGSPVPDPLRKNIEDLRSLIAKEEAEILTHEQERKTVEARYQFDIERFRLMRPDSR